MSHSLSLKEAQQAVEKDLIQRALHFADGHLTRASKILEISHRGLLYKIKDYGIDLEACAHGEYQLSEAYQAGQRAKYPLPEISGGRSLKDMVNDGAQELEKDLIAQALRQAHGDTKKAVQLLGISRKSLMTKREKFSL